MRLYADGGLAAVMVTSESIRNTMVDIQVSQTRLIHYVILSSKRHHSLYFSPLIQQR